jgi:hypothetical protein
MVSCMVIVESLLCVLSLSNAVQKVANQWLARCSSGVPRTRSRASPSKTRISSLISARRSSWSVLAWSSYVPSLCEPSTELLGCHTKGTHGRQGDKTYPMDAKARGFVLKD